MAITYKSIQTIENGVNTFTLDGTSEYLIFGNAAARASGTTAFTLDAATVTDGSGNTLTLTSRIIQKMSANVLGGSPAVLIAMFFGKPSEATPAALVAGTCTLNLTYSIASGSLNAAAPDTFVIECDMGTSASDPYVGAATGMDGASSDPFTAFGDLALQTGGFAVAFAIRGTTATMSAAGSATGGTWTQRADDTTFSGVRASIQTKDVSADYTETALQLNPSVATAHTGYFVWFKENNAPALTSATTAPFEPGETVTLAGTALDTVGTGARIRKVGGTSSYDALSFTPGTSTSATGVIPNRPTRTPYTSEDGTTHTIEFVATLSGTPSGAATTALTTDNFVPPAGYSRVTITAPDLTANSLLSYLGWTSVAGDQLEWDNAVNVSGTDVTVTVNSDGTVSLDSGVNPMPGSVPFYWRAYSTASEQWTGSASNQSDWATATFGAGSGAGSADAGGLSMSAIRRRRR